jgi:hypothetical protein
MAMNHLVFHCPNTGYRLDTGLEIAVNRGALRQVQPITLLLLCPLCGNRHVWKLADGWLCEPQRSEKITGPWRPV